MLFVQQSERCAVDPELKFTRTDGIWGKTFFLNFGKKLFSLAFASIFVVVTYQVHFCGAFNASSLRKVLGSSSELSLPNMMHPSQTNDETSV